MKKMNNKGFAISSLLYGLLIVGFLVITLLMSSMATNRSNTKILIEKIEEELGRYGRTSAEFDSSPNPQQFIVPYNKSGWYKIELWHKNASESRYLSAVVKLAENQHLNFEVKDDFTKVTATSKGTSQVLLEAKAGSSDTSITGNGVIDSNTINVQNVLNIPASTNITAKAKIQLLGTNPPLNTVFEPTAGYSYYIKDSDDNFVEALVITNPDGTKTGTASGTQYDDMNFMKWLIEKNADATATYKIVTTNSNLALYDDGTGNLKLDTIKDVDQQKWIITSPGSNKYKIQNKATNKFLNIDTSSAGTDSSGEEIYLIKADY